MQLLEAVFKVPLAVCISQKLGDGQSRFLTKLTEEGTKGQNFKHHCHYSISKSYVSTLNHLAYINLFCTMVGGVGRGGGLFLNSSNSFFLKN